MRTRADLALIGVTIIWGTTFVVVKAALSDASPFIFLALRFLLAAVLLGLIYRHHIRRSAVTAGLIAGCLLFTAYVFQTVGLEFTTPSKSAFLTGLSIPMVPLASSCVYRVRPRLVEVAGIVIATVGMMLMTVSPWGALQSGVNKGDLLSFLCAVTFALHIVVIGHYSPLIGHESLSVIQIGVGAIAGLTLFSFAGPVRLHFTPALGGALLITGPFATALAFTTQAWAQKYTSATRAALIFALEPVVAWFTSWVLTGETMPNRGKVGAGAILAGILLVECIRSERGLETSGRGAETKAAKATSLEA